MKKTIYFLFTFILLLLTSNCSNEKNYFTLKGKIKGLSSDTLLIYYQVPEFKIDSLFCKNGNFEYSFIPDTFTVFSLVFNNEESLPIFAERGQTVEISGTTDSLSIKGKGENKLMNEIIKLLRTTPQQSIKLKVDSLITSNKYSFTNLYLLDKYYLHNEHIDYESLSKLIDSQGGVIKDTYYMINLQNRIDFLNTSDYIPQNIYSLSGESRNGEAIKWTTITKDKYTLLDFWASWHPESIAQQDSLEKVIKALKKEKFQLVSFSLDIDKEDWLKESERDTTKWLQVCDFKGWNSSIVKSQKIHKLPYNILLDKNKRIIARNIRGQELIDKVKQLIKEDKRKEQAAKKRK